MRNSFIRRRLQTDDQRTVGRKFDIDTLTLLFNSLVKSTLLFGIIVWYASSVTGRDFVEGVQNRFTITVLKEWPDERNNYRIRPYSERCLDLKVDSILKKYIFSCRAFIYDTLHDRLKSNFLKSKSTWNASRVTRSTELINIRTFRSNYLQNQPLWSAVRHFNSSKAQYKNYTERNKYIKAVKL